METQVQDYQERLDSVKFAQLDKEREMENLRKVSVLTEINGGISLPEC